MPKSKRAQVITLSQTTKRTRKDKQELLDNVREAVDRFQNVYIFSVSNMRNAFIKEIRQSMKESVQMFYGKNKVMAKALGSNEEEEYKKGLSLVAEKLQGSVGLLMSNLSKEDLEGELKHYEQQDYARSGSIATKTVTLKEGLLTRGEKEEFPHNMEPQLRALGLPTKLVQGKIYLTKDYTICEEGKELTTEAAHLLKHFYIPMAQFKVELTYQWCDGKME